MTLSNTTKMATRQLFDEFIEGLYQSKISPARLQSIVQEYHAVDDWRWKNYVDFYNSFCGTSQTQQNVDYDKIEKMIQRKTVNAKVEVVYPLEKRSDQKLEIEPTYLDHLVKKQNKTIDADHHRLIDIANATEEQDAITLKQHHEDVQKLQTSKLSLDGTLKMTGNLDMNQHEIINVKESTVFASREYVNQQLKRKLNNDQPIDMKGRKIIHLATPTNHDDAATKQYVDDNKSKTSTPTIDKDIDLQNKYKLVNVVDPVQNQDAASKHYVDKWLRARLKLDGSTAMEGQLNMNQHEIINLPLTPQYPHQATNKAYVDSIKSKALEEVKTHISSQTISKNEVEEFKKNMEMVKGWNKEQFKKEIDDLKKNMNVQLNAVKDLLAEINTIKKNSTFELHLERYLDRYASKGLTEKLRLIDLAEKMKIHLDVVMPYIFVASIDGGVSYVIWKWEGTEKAVVQWKSKFDNDDDVGTFRWRFRFKPENVPKRFLTPWYNDDFSNLRHNSWIVFGNRHRFDYLRTDPLKNLDGNYSNMSIFIVYTMHKPKTNNNSNPRQPFSNGLFSQCQNHKNIDKYNYRSICFVDDIDTIDNSPQRSLVITGVETDNGTGYIHMGPTIVNLDNFVQKAYPIGAVAGGFDKRTVLSVHWFGDKKNESHVYCNAEYLFSFQNKALPNLNDPIILGSLSSAEGTAGKLGDFDKSLQNAGFFGTIHEVIIFNDSMLRRQKKQTYNSLTNEQILGLNYYLMRKYGVRLE